MLAKDRVLSISTITQIEADIDIVRINKQKTRKIIIVTTCITGYCMAKKGCSKKGTIILTSFCERNGGGCNGTRQSDCLTCGTGTGYGYVGTTICAG